MQFETGRSPIMCSDTCMMLGGETVQRGATTFHNVAACNDQYVLMNQPKIMELSS